MARARKTAVLNTDGMSWLQVMPFPAVNPWNWGALALPRNAIITSFAVMEAGVQAWRTGADAMRIAARAQQDVWLGLAHKQLAPSDAEPEATSDAEPASETADEVADFVTPMLEVTRAYGRAGKAFIVAQRNTMRAFTGAGKPH
jgi:hypothetical protein